MGKNNYLAPSIDLVEMEVEMGIAVSTTVDGFSDIYLFEEDVEW